MIYGVALLAGCMFIGTFVGNVLGLLTGLNSDIGGVGFAMILLLIVTNSSRINKILPATYVKGINFWKEMYIPVTVAMAASQNVISALNGGIVALVLGLCVVLIMLLLIPVFNKFTSKEAVEKDAVGRVKEVQYYINEIEKRAEAMCLGECIHREGKLPKRICHCDTKVNNMLFDKGHYNGNMHHH